MNDKVDYKRKEAYLSEVEVEVEEKEEKEEQEEQEEKEEKEFKPH